MVTGVRVYAAAATCRARVSVLITADGWHGRRMSRARLWVCGWTLSFHVFSPHHCVNSNVNGRVCRFIGIRRWFSLGTVVYAVPRRCMIGGDLNSDVILCCHDSSRPISRAHPASARSTVLTNYGLWYAVYLTRDRFFDML